MAAGWLGYLGAAFFFYAAYKAWKDPFNAFDDIDDWEDVTDENRSHFNKKRTIIGTGGILTGLVFIALAEPLTTKFQETFFDPTELITPMTISDYDCDDAAEQVKTLEFRNNFGAVFTVMVARSAVEIERTETKLSCRMTSILSNGIEVSMTAGFEEIDGEIFVRGAVDN